MSEIKVYTLEEVQHILKVTQRTTYNYVRSGKLKAVKLGREWRITEDALREFLQLTNAE